MDKSRESARERNARIRREQQQLSEERSRRSLRSEDFREGNENNERVQLKRVSEPVREHRTAGSTTKVPHSGTHHTVKKPHRTHQKHQPQRSRSMDARRQERKAVRKQERHEFRKERRNLMQSAALQLESRHESDFTLIACIVLLSFIGLVMVTSSSYYYAFHNMNGDSYHFFKKQMTFLLGGCGVMAVAAVFSLKWIKRLSWVVYAFAVACTILVLFIGKSVNGSTRWIVIGPIQFQPAEFAKLGIALFLSVKVEQYQKTIGTGRTFLKLLGILMLPTAFVIYQNLSSGLIIAVIGMVIMFVGGCKIRYFLMLAGAAAALFFVVIVLPALIPLDLFPEFMQGFMEKFMYRSNRIEAFLDPFKYAQGTGYQTVQSLYAIGSGGIFGVGLGESIQKLGFIPEAYNDIIFAIICEELGLIGATIVILLFAMLVKQGIHIAMDAPDRYTTYVAAGLTTQVGIQAIMNVAVNTNTIPATGASLPFISYGGTAMVLLLGSMGILLNISRYTRNTGSKPTVTE